MSGVFTVDHGSTFQAAFLMGTAPKNRFGEERQDADSNGQPKWTAEVAVTFIAQNGMKAQSEVLSVTLVGADPAASVPPGSPIVFEGLRLGLNPPEKNDRGGIRGGKLYYQASALRSVNGHPAKRGGE